MPIKEVQKTHTQHAVPQNIMDVEFKLIGDLTMRQFTYLLIFGVLSYIAYISLVGVFKYPVSMFFVLFGLALAFIPIQERGMDEWFVNFFRSVYSPTQRVWKKEPVLPAAFTYQNIAMVKQELITLAPTSSRRKLEEYLEIQQKAQIEDKLDIPEREYVLKVRQAFAPVTAGVDVAVEEEEYREEYVEYEIPEKEVPEEEFKPEEKVPEVKPFEEVSKPEPGKPELKKPEKPAKPAHPRERGKEVRKPKPKPKPRPKAPAFIPDTFTLFPITPDRHIGRKFTSMLPSEGQLILPVKGEKVIQTSEELDIQKDIDEKTEQLRRLLDQIKGDKELRGVVRTPAPLEVPGEKEEISEAQDVVRKVKEENERLTNEIEKLKNELQESQTSEEEKRKKLELIKKLEDEQKRANTDYTTLQRQVHELQKRLKEKEEPASAEEAQPKKPTYAKMQPITNEPNTISGVVKNQNGGAVTGVVLLIKNHKGESVRALKTNTIGQFSISTPLVNGLYTLEVGSSVEGLTFDIITVEVKGEVLPPIEIIGRLV